MTRGPIPRNVMIGDAIVALLRDAAQPMTTRELCDGLGRWDMPTFTSCPQDPAKRAEVHAYRWTDNVELISCLLKPWRGAEWHDFGQGRYDWVVHTLRRPLISGDIAGTLTRLVRNGDIVKLRIDRYNATVYSAAPTLVPVDDLEAMWRA